MKAKITAFILMALMCVFILASCGEDCTHKDADDNGKCDSCGETFADGCDKTECIDANGDGKCDSCGGTVTPPPACEHKDANSDGVCDSCGETMTPPPACEHKDANSDGACDSCGETMTPPAHLRT